ncbi:MAG TPA: sodium-translocating pyrophosphatase [Elusimicrobiota bacterium]|nr:sodium-translocating pyrophosphatase [Elusimicrobiota bacterium]
MTSFIQKLFKDKKAAFMGLSLLGALAVAVFAQVSPEEAAEGGHEGFQFFSFMTSPLYASYEKVALWVVLGVAFAGLLYALSLVKEVLGADKGTPKMQEITQAIRQGADAYLKRQLTTVAILISVLVVLLYLSRALPTKNFGDPIAFGRAVAFFMGALFSGLVGFVGMRLATTGNLRVAAAAKTSFGRALQLGYRTGTITGMLTDGLGLLGGTVIFMAFGEKAYEVLLGFGFGGTLLALFMRVGGGIYTKAADVGADLVGKIEVGVPEDDPRNAATIADNVGDNVGDCAGMAADIFESYEVTIVAAMILGWASFGHKGVIFPILVRAIGVFASIIGTYLVRAGDKGSAGEAMKSINVGFWVSSVISIIGFVVLGFFYLRFDADYFARFPQVAAVSQNLPWLFTFGVPGLDMRAAWTCFIGILLAVALNRCTEYFTGTEFAPVKGCVRACATGHATNIIEGLAVGFESSVWAILIIAGSIFASAVVYANTNPIFVAFGVAMCGIGMLTLTGNTISMDVFGPVADNANGIGEMGYDAKEMGPENYKNARQILADLDAVGNTTKAITKGIAIGSAVIAAVSLFASFITVIASGGQGEDAQVPIELYNAVAGLLKISDPTLLIGLLIGGAVPFLFSSMTIRAVGRAAYLIVQECRHQFKVPGVMEGTKLPDYGKVVGICTASAQKELIGPGMLAVMTPILVGFALGPMALAGFLAGTILSGQLIAVFMANAGGAWDNAKKCIEDEPRDPAKNTGKGSERHKAAVTGDTVGDPLKDTSGPAINPLIKVMNMVALLVVPLVIPFSKPTIETLKSTAETLFQAQQIPQHFYDRLMAMIAAPMGGLSVTIIVVALSTIVWAVWQSKRESEEMRKAHADIAGGK